VYVEYFDSTVAMIDEIPAGGGGGVYSGEAGTDPLRMVRSIHVSPFGGDAGQSSGRVVGGVVESLPTTPYSRSVGMYPTADYVQWPYNVNSMWSSIPRPIVTDYSVAASEPQVYSASMVFDHTHSDVKTVNFIRYDGPDLDKGLCVYLPAMSNGLYPDDGYLMEFHVSVFPTLGYTESVEQVLVANMSHVYFYSVPNMDCYTGSMPVAKVGQARTVGYRVDVGDITVPAKPANWHLKFAFSSHSLRWVLVSIAQLDDHVLCPGGMIDPAQGTLGGYASNNLPTYQDPFGDYAIQPVVGSGTDWSDQI
jgi:hypothetical protein